jgi:ElaB/YqjD/DUF883 family membrane-anchored ribosome-binding protein
MARQRKTVTTRKRDARLGALRSDIDALKSDTKSIVADGKDLAHDRAHAAIRNAESVAERAYQLAEETATEWADEVETWTNDNLESARETVRSQPLSAMLFSVGIGALLGSLFLRR